jgi:hypothetical protein
MKNNKTVTEAQVLHFMDVQFGDDIVIKSCEQIGKDFKVIWHEVGDEERNFSIVGIGRYGKLTEKVGG